MRAIQQKSLPIIWLQQISKFDVGSSSFSENAKVIARRLIEFIKEEGDDSLLNPLARSLILHVVFNKNFFSEYYDCVPVELINDGMNETKGVTGFDFTRKLHSVFVELFVYIQLSDNGFKYNNISRSSGSCDLLMKKNNKDYNFEVKFKESKDVFKSRLFDCIDGMSLLDEYSFLRGNTYEIYVKSENINYEIEKEILTDINNFMAAKKDIYVSKHIEIFNVQKRKNTAIDINNVSGYCNSLLISQELIDEDSVSELIQRMLIDNNGHITKLKDKSEVKGNFNGCLVWDVPFHNDIDSECIKSAFKKLKLNFDLYVFVGGIAKEGCNFFIGSNQDAHPT